MPTLEASHPTVLLDFDLEAERARLIRLCASLIGDAGSAEDLAQETLLEAWRHAHKLHDPSGARPWLSAIARNICLRWMRSRGREASHLVPVAAADRPSAERPVEAIADTLDLEVELDRSSLAALLDQALALLSPETRQVMLGRCLEDLPQAEVAARLGISEGTVAVRLHRGKLALRKLLAGELVEAAASHGLWPSADGRWEETAIWCPICGCRRLVGRLEAAAGELVLKCPVCTPDPHTDLGYSRLPEELRGVRSYQGALSRVMDWAEVYFRRGLAHGTAPCPLCGREMTMQIRTYDPPLFDKYRYRIVSECPACGYRDEPALLSLTMSSRSARQFWADHPRMEVSREQEVERSGRLAVITTLQSSTTSARLDLVLSLDTYEVVPADAL